MLIEARKFMFTVSLCAMLAVNPVLATTPESDDDLDTTHDVYVESTLPSVEGYQTAGIAGVSYVNRMVDAAGNAAQAAEGHAAAAGAYALSAAESADEAHEVLAGKVDLAQGADNKNKVMVTNGSGNVYPGYVTSNMIAPDSIDGRHIFSSGAEIGAVLMSKDGLTGIRWGHISPENFELSGVLAASVLVVESGSSDMYAAWSKIKPENTSGIVGVVPVGSADATTYANFWIE